MPMQEVEKASHELVRAIDRLNAALDAVGDDRLAYPSVAVKAPVELRQLAARVSDGQSSS